MKLASRFAGWIAAFLAVGYIGIFCIISFLRYQSFGFNDFDFAVYAQALWAILHGSIHSSILGIPFLGNHLDLILFLIAPLYAVFPSPLTLLFLQTIFLGLGVVPVYLLAGEKLGKAFAAVFSILYLFYPALHFLNHFEFHPVAFATPFLLFMWYFFEKSRFIPFLVFMFLAMSCKENIPLGVIFFGLYVKLFTRGDRKWRLVPSVCGLFWFIAGILTVRHFNQGLIDFGSLYRGIFEVGIGRVLLSWHNLEFSFQLLAPLAFFPLLAPEILFAASPFFLMQFLSLRGTDHSILYHYTAALIPFLFVAAVVGTSRLLNSGVFTRPKMTTAGLLLVFCFASNVWFGLVPKLWAGLPRDYVLSDLDRAKANFIGQIPPEASVVATFEFLPKLSKRLGLYSFHHVVMNAHTLAAYPGYRLPEDVEYALIDFDDPLTFSAFYPAEGYRNLQRFFSEDAWGLVAASGSVGLFKRGFSSSEKLYEILEQPPAGGRSILIERDIRMVQADGSGPLVSEGKIRFSLIWESLRKTDKDYWIGIRFVDSKGESVRR